MIAANLDILMFAALCGGILIGYPVLFTLAGIAVAFALLGTALGAFDLSLMGALAQRVFGIMINPILMAIPMFVLMGVILERSRIAESLLEEMGRLFGPIPGGLAASVVVVGALLAASTGIVGATVVTMALISLPTMLRHGYDRRFAAGTVCTAGTLGQIIPPSTMLIILSAVMSNSYQQAQFARGLFTVETISVGQIFAAAMLPGLVLVGVYLVYVLARAALKPSVAPAVPRPAGERLSIRRVGSVLVPPILLIVAVLGSILGGVATPTEAASVGAIGALLLGGLRLSPDRSPAPILAAIASLAALAVLAGSVEIRPQRSDAGLGQWLLAAVAAGLCLAAVWGLWESLRRLRAAGVVGEIATRTMTISAMIFGTIIGASVFSLVFRGLGGDTRIEDILAAMPGGADGALIFVMVLIFVLGFFLDFVEISIIVLPIVGPTLMLLGHDPIWLAVLIAVNLQTSFLTPPFGFSLFYLRGAAPKEISTAEIYRGVAPFVVLQIVGVALIWMFPAIATTLPRLLFG